MIYEHFRIAPTFSDHMSVTLRVDDVQGFDTQMETKFSYLSGKLPRG